MAKIDTATLIEMFFEENTGVSYKHYKPFFFSSEIQSFEQEVGKSILDITDTTLLLTLISRMSYTEDAQGQRTYRPAHSSFNQIKWIFGKLWDYYSVKFQDYIYNPWRSLEMRGTKAEQALAGLSPRITTKLMNDTIDSIRRDQPSDRADYLECIMLLWYSGFRNADEIAMLQESHIIHKVKRIVLEGRTITLSDRCYELLLRVHAMTSISSRKSMAMVPWHNGYFKFPHTMSSGSIDNMDIHAVTNKIYALYRTHVTLQYNFKLNYTALYYLGLYDYIVNQCGEEHAKELISTMGRATSDELGQYAEEYGIYHKSGAELKRILAPYL